MPTDSFELCPGPRKGIGIKKGSGRVGHQKETFERLTSRVREPTGSFELCPGPRKGIGIKKASEAAKRNV